MSTTPIEEATCAAKTSASVWPGPRNLHKRSRARQPSKRETRDKTRTYIVHQYHSRVACVRGDTHTIHEIIPNSSQPCSRGTYETCWFAATRQTDVGIFSSSPLPSFKFVFWHDCLHAVSFFSSSPEQGLHDKNQIWYVPCFTIQNGKIIYRRRDLSALSKAQHAVPERSGYCSTHCDVVNKNLHRASPS